MLCYHWICSQLPRRFRSRLFYLIWPEIDLIFTKFSPFLTNERGDAPETLPMARTGQEEFLRKLGPVPFLWGSLIILGMPGSNWRSKGQILRSQGKRGHFFSEISSTIAYCTPPPKFSIKWKLILSSFKWDHFQGWGVGSGSYQFVKMVRKIMSNLHAKKVKGFKLEGTLQDVYTQYCSVNSETMGIKL